MNYRLIGVFLIVLFPVSAHGAFTDFEDLTADSTYSVGETIASKELTFNVVDFHPTSSTVLVSGPGSVNGSPLELWLRGNGVEIVLAPDMQYISLLYGDFYIDSGIIVNGISSPLATGFSGLDGSTIAGISIGVTSQSVVGGELGELTLSGPIDSFVIGGFELGIDDVTVLVPEPSTALLLMAACVLPFVVPRR